jgi:hypothetical protein
MSAERVIEESLPMLDDVLGQIGIHRSGSPLDFVALRPRFSEWLLAQTSAPGDVPFLTSLVGAFICEHLIRVAAANRYIGGNRIMLRVPFASGVEREFDPYATAMGLVQNRSSLDEFLQAVAT